MNLSIDSPGLGRSEPQKATKARCLRSGDPMPTDGTCSSSVGPAETVAMTEASEQVNNASSANSMKVVVWPASVMPRVEVELS